MVQNQELVISSSGLTKEFGAIRAVDDVNIEVPNGSVYGFLGPNGSGKTTTIRILLGLVSPTSGNWSLLGSEMPKSERKVLPRIGSLVEGPAFYPWMTGRENLSRFDAATVHVQRSSRDKRIAEALERVGLTLAADRKYKAYSLGMKQRLGLASSLLRDRDLLILDEPTNGMDPQGTREIRSLIKSLADSGTTVLLSSHLLSEVEQVCTHVGVMSKGRLVSQGTIDGLRDMGESRLRIRVNDPGKAQIILTALGLGDFEIDQDQLRASLGGIEMAACCKALVDGDVEVKELIEERASLEDLFLSLTGEGFDVAR